MTAACSIITLVSNRNRHLQNLLIGLERGRVLPAEVIVVDMGDTVRGVEFGSLAVQLLQIPHTDAHLPLARARNAGAAAASTEKLIFLDVDCIPSATFVADMNTLLDEYPNALLMGTPRYLHRPVAGDFTFAALQADAEFHPHRPQPVDKVSPCAHYELFWSLCFGLCRETFERIGGFDESYLGYGAEDTDFAFMARREKVPFYLIASEVYHQQHGVYRPPLNRLTDIVLNSNRFYQKWNLWPMGGWLREFASAGHINWSEEQKQEITVLRLPTEQELNAAHCPDAPYV